MGYAIQKNDVNRSIRFRMVSSADHVSGVTGIVPVVTICKEASTTFNAPIGVLTEVGNGWYQLAPNSTDNNTLGPLILKATGAGADECSELYEVVAYDPDVEAIGILATAIGNSPTAGTVEAALLAAEAQGIGKWTIVGTTLTLYRNDGVTVVRTFTLDSASSPTSRT